MTTNVFDSVAGTIATDSRWSQRQGRWVVYVDDVPFEKLQVHNTTAFVFAGRGVVIQAWKDWIASKPKDFSALPPFDGISVCVVDTAASAVKFTRGDYIVRDGGYFAGSGGSFAFECWAANRDACRSVETAKRIDPRTGGLVKYYRTGTGEHNLHRAPEAKFRIEQVDEAIKARGTVMDIRAIAPGAIPFKLSDLAADAGDADLMELKAKVESGELSAEAPCDAMYSEWTAEEQDRLKAVLADVLDMDV